MPAGAAERLPEDFVYLRDVAPGIVQDMRYAGCDNFTGRPCPATTRPNACCGATVAQALARVQADLARENLEPESLRLLSPDPRGRRLCALGANGATTMARPNVSTPTLEKRSLFAQGYIAAHSRHSTGTAVDLTLVRLPPRRRPPSTATRLRRLHRTARQRAPDNSLDMGTGFDCFDEKATPPAPPSPSRHAGAPS